jgi:trehalose 6-phosphate synthase
LYSNGVVCSPSGAGNVLVWESRTGSIVDIVVSNRVARTTPENPMMGGLAAALLPAVRRSGVVWFGTSGRTRRLAPDAAPLIQIESYGRGTIATVDAPEQHYTRFYEGFANSALWPILHSRLDLSRVCPEDYASYREMNAYMARVLATFGRAESHFWVHDYHFLPLGRELRKLGIVREIGFFLHTPWPSARVMSALPQCRELAEAMLAYDLIGFQTDKDRANFAELLRNHLRIPASGSTFRTRSGTCCLATFPIGIDAEDFADRAQKAAVDPEVRRLHASLGATQLIIGVDRIDYSKGLPQRIQALEHLLTQYPRFKHRLSLLQIAVPSRSSIETYRTLQHDVAALVGEINAKHSEVDWCPIRYVTKSFCQSTLAGFYRASAVGLVTPLQDGMNLVAKEYIAAQDTADPGVLVLSRSAGAARELDAALQVDPQDIEGIARQIATALTMSLEERCARWQSMMDVLLRHSVHAWFSDFMQALIATRPGIAAPAARVALVPAQERTAVMHR